MKKFVFLSLIILFSIKTQNIFANQNIFTVDNIVVNGELTSDNSNSREKYLNIVFKKAFKNLVINLLRKDTTKDDYNYINNYKIVHWFLLSVNPLITIDSIKQNNKHINQTSININKKSLKYTNHKNIQINKNTIIKETRKNQTSF